MPRQAPFTWLCGQWAELARPRVVDLHIHTTASDGEYTPSQVMAHARRLGLAAVAITDHDTLAGWVEAQQAAGDAVTWIPGVEISTVFEQREVHLLGYFLRDDHPGLNTALARLQQSRRERFYDWIHQLAHNGIRLPEDRVQQLVRSSTSLGRRHVAQLLLRCGKARSYAEAFHRYVQPLAKQVLPKTLLPIEKAIALVHEAGGVTSLAHPPADWPEESFLRLRACGLDAIEAVYPRGRRSSSVSWRLLASQWGFAVTGGSDCHGPASQRSIGSYGIHPAELVALRRYQRKPTACTGR
ncbi:MAG: PHP domain-containing protein [Gemmataceae bacterium]|nr:PHP domain-containing protein [Gemmata sp.]MDW8196583.1 PHP domain-containing protein [Gemmataceae bacterium]